MVTYLLMFLIQNVTQYYITSIIYSKMGKRKAMLMYSITLPDNIVRFRTKHTISNLDVNQVFSKELNSNIVWIAILLLLFASRLLYCFNAKCTTTCISFSAKDTTISFYANDKTIQLLPFMQKVQIFILMQKIQPVLLIPTSIRTRINTTYDHLLLSFHISFIFLPMLILFFS